MIVCPTLSSDLPDGLLSFWTHPIAISADISKMYRAVELATLDSDFNRFIWRTELNSDILDYVMTSITFGVSATPYFAVQLLHQTATEFGKDHLFAHPRVYDSFYVDDCMIGAETPDQVFNLQ